MKETANNEFSPQVVTEKVSLYVGYYEGTFAIAVTGKEFPTSVSSTKLIKVEKIDNELKGLIFLLQDEDLLEVFISFAFDLESFLKNYSDISLIEMYNRYLFWQKMFKGVKNEISENVLKGLINELYILNKFLIPEYGLNEAVSSWIGAEAAHKDFALTDGTWFEAKAIDVGKNTVKISSIEQLDSSDKGFLVVSHVEKTSYENTLGLNLYRALKNLTTQVTEENVIGELYSKVISLGVDISSLVEEKNELNSKNYIFHSTDFFEVHNDFPRINRETFPKAFGNISYELLLSEINDYKSELFDKF